MTTHPIYDSTNPDATYAATSYDDVHEARLLLDDTYERGVDYGLLRGRLEAVVVMALAAGAGCAVWLVVGP